MMHFLYYLSVSDGIQNCSINYYTRQLHSTEDSLKENCLEEKRRKIINVVILMLYKEIKK